MKKKKESLGDNGAGNGGLNSPTYMRHLQNGSAPPPGFGSTLSWGAGQEIPWGPLIWKWVIGTCALKTPFSQPLMAAPLDPPARHFRIFQFLKTLCSPEITTFWKICILRSQNRGKVLFLILKFGQISVPRASNEKISSLWPQIWRQSVL